MLLYFMPRGLSGIALVHGIKKASKIHASIIYLISFFISKHIKVWYVS